MGGAGAESVCNQLWCCYINFHGALVIVKKCYCITVVLKHFHQNSNVCTSQNKFKTFLTRYARQKNISRKLDQKYTISRLLFFAKFLFVTRYIVVVGDILCVKKLFTRE